MSEAINNIVESVWENPKELKPEPLIPNPQGVSTEFANKYPNSVKELELNKAPELHNQQRFYTAINLRKAYYLKQYSSLLSLYDELNPQEEKNYASVFNYQTTSNAMLKRTYGVILIPMLMMATSLKLKKVHPFLFSSYIENFYMVMPIGIFSAALTNFFFSMNGMGRQMVIDNYRDIYDSRNFLHMQATVLNNELKYPDTENI